MSTRRKRRDGDPSDRVRLEHMLLAAREAAEFIDGKGRSDLDANRLLVRGLCHVILEIGEAAANLSSEARSRVPGVPWPDVVRMRNIMVHVNWGISLNKLWETVTSDLPQLQHAIQKSLSDWPLELE